jgi:septum formation protein
LILKKKIILASTSPYRAELLRRLQLPFNAAHPDVDEVPLQGEKPVETALRLSLAKAASISDAFPGSLIIGSDQVADLNGNPVGKPGTRERAHEQLLAMRGQTLVFHSGIALLNSDTGKTQSTVVATTVRFREYADNEIESYLDRENALDCAGSAKSEGLGIALVASMQSDDPTALVGMPLIALVNMLRHEGVEVLA